MKKGIFTPMLVLFTLIILVSLAFTISNTEKQKEKIITGETPIELIKLYNEGEKISFYLDESIKLSLKNALQVLKENSGYPENNNCKKDLNNLVIWDVNCNYFDIDENFNTQFKIEINNYINIYKKQNPKQQIPEPIITKDNNKLLIEFRDIKFENSIENKNLLKKFSAEYIINPKTELDNPDLIIYNEIYYKVQLCNLRETIQDQEIENCINNLKSIKNTVVTQNNDLLKVENNGIIILINTKQTLQPPKKPLV